MPFRANNKTNPGKKKKLQEKSKLEKIQRLRQRLMEKEIARKKAQEELEFACSLYNPGRLYKPTGPTVLAVKHRRIYVPADSILLFVKVTPSQFTKGWYNFTVIFQEEIGYLTSHVSTASKMMVPVDNSSVLA